MNQYLCNTFYISCYVSYKHTAQKQQQRTFPARDNQSPTVNFVSYPSGRGPAYSGPIGLKNSELMGK